MASTRRENGNEDNPLMRWTPKPSRLMPYDFFLVGIYQRQCVLPSYAPNPARIKITNNKSHAVYNPGNTTDTECLG